MSKTAKNILEKVGGTPLVEISDKLNKGGAKVLAKVEFFNPGGSVKDRIALAMVETAEKDGVLKPGATIIEPTSGNTGVGLALVSAVKGYHLILTMPETMSIERRKLAAAYGAEIVLTPGSAGMKGAIAKANELRDTTPGAVILQQFENPANPDFHYRTTGPEVWEGTGGEVAAFVAGVGTGGTITGTGKFLKEKNPAVKLFAVEPDTSPVLSGGQPGPHKIQGIGTRARRRAQRRHKRVCSSASRPAQRFGRRWSSPSVPSSRARRLSRSSPTRANAIFRRGSLNELHGTGYMGARATPRAHDFRHILPHPCHLGDGVAI